MIVNSAKEYRNQIKNDKYRPDVDEDFMGYSHGSKENHKYGFFNLFHGIKDNIEKYLPSILDIAEDNQAVYEFLQNAVDCKATHFYAFYNDDYFLAVNNGAKFSVEGLTSILNIAQSTKSDSSSIGRLGIGFKLAHRLVGKGNGVSELVHSNKGPVMFSWDDASHLRSLMSSEDISYGGIDENAFLLKIAITNFPVNAGEVVKDINYNDVVAFPETELEEFRKYTTECLAPMFEQNMADFSQGTLFFIKLGENKRKLLDEDLATLKNGIEYSMNTLRQLDHICFNGEVIHKKELRLCESSIAKDTDIFKKIDPQYSDYDILYSFGFLPLNFTDNGYYKAVDQLRKSPNFYKYFPMGDEVDNMALFIHSDSFQVEANRRKLINHHTNRELLLEIASFIVKKLDEFRTSDRQKFMQLFGSILLTNKPGVQEKTWMNEIFFDKLYAAIKTCVPTLTGFSNDATKVKIKKVNIDIPLDQIGHADKQWFVWTGEYNKELLTEAINADKLGIEEWNINSIIVKANNELLNKWLNSCEEAIFDAFINEIRVTTTSNEAKALLPNIKLYKFGNERKSRKEIDADKSYVIMTSKTAPIKSILQKVGMKCSDTTHESHPLSSLLSAQREINLYSNIKEYIESDAAHLTASEKLELVTSLSSFENIADNAIKQLQIFKNCQGGYSSLSNLTAYITNAADWQLPYIIAKEENFAEIQKFLVLNESLYQDIVGDEYDNIFDTPKSIDTIYTSYQKQGQPWPSSLTIRLIRKFGATDEVLSLIEKTSDKDSIDAFIRRIDALPLSTKESYESTSYAYRCIQLASKMDAASLKSKITVDGIKLSDFASSDTLLFKVTQDNKEKIYNLKLSDVLPDDTQCAIYGKIVSKFSSIANYTTIFSADRTNAGNVSSRLMDILKQDGTVVSPAQYAYILLMRAQADYSSLGFWEKYVRLEKEQVVEIISYFYDKDLIPLLAQYKSCYPWRNFVEGKYLFSTDYTLETERGDKAVEDWCGSDINKCNALKEIGFRFDDCAEIKRRISFKNNTMTEWGSELKLYPNSFVHWVYSIAPVLQDKQVAILDMLSQKFNNIYTKKQFVIDDYADAIELSTEKYIKWRSSDKIRIFLLQTKMPYRITYNCKELLCTGFDGDFFYFRDKKCLYIKAADDAEVATALAQVYTDNTVPFNFEDFISLCSNSIEEQREKDEQILELKSRLEKYEQLQNDNKVNQFQDFIREYSENVSEFMGGGFAMPEDKIKAKHVIARYRGLKYIKEHAMYLSISPNFDEKEYIRSEKYSSILLADGKKVHVQSAIYGIWYLSPSIWDDIVNHGHYACLCTGLGENDFMMIKNRNDIKAIAESCNNILMKMTPSNSMDIMSTSESILNPDSILIGDNIRLDTIYTDRNVHLMLKVHQTPNSDLNSIFDEYFNSEGNMELD